MVATFFGGESLAGGALLDRGGFYLIANGFTFCIAYKINCFCPLSTKIRKNSFAFYANGKELFQNPDISVKTRFQNQNIQVEISGLSKYELVLLQNTKSNVYLSPKSDIILTLNGGTTATIEKADLETQSLGKIFGQQTGIKEPAEQLV